MRFITANFLDKARNLFKLKAPVTDRPVAAVTPLPKEQVFGGQMNPGQPLPTFPINAPSAVSGRVPARAWEFTPGYNLRNRPDGERQASNQVLRWLSNYHLVTRAAINVRKKEIVGLKWDVGPADEKRGVSEDKINTLRKFWAKPDGRQAFSQWLNEILEDLFVLDALCLEKRRKRNGQLLGLDIVDGATIKILIDNTGRQPLPPEPAYQQIIYGSARADFTLDELIYNPYNNAPNSPYGKSFLESALLEVNMSLKALMTMLGYFTEGNIPAGFINAPEGANSTQMAEMQTALDIIAQNTESKAAQLQVIPAGATYQAVKDYDPAKFTDLNDVLTRAVLMAFEVQPQEVGLTFQVNKSSGEIQENITYRRAIRPLLGYLEDIFNEIMAFDLDSPDMAFHFEAFEAEDALTKAQEYEIYAGGKQIMTVNEIRQERGLESIEGGDELNAPAPVLTDGLFSHDWPEVEKELARWERKALNGGREKLFLSDVLPSTLIEEIGGSLKTAGTDEAVRLIFADVKKKYQPQSTGKLSTDSYRKTYGRLPRRSGNSTGNGGKASLTRLVCPRRY